MKRTLTILLACLVIRHASADIAVARPTASINRATNTLHVNGSAYLTAERTARLALAIDEHIAYVSSAGRIISQEEHVASWTCRLFSMPAPWTGTLTHSASIPTNSGWPGAFPAPFGTVTVRRWFVIRPEGLTPAGEVCGPSLRIDL